MQVHRATGSSGLLLGWPAKRWRSRRGLRGHLPGALSRCRHASTCACHPLGSRTRSAWLWAVCLVPHCPASASNSAPASQATELEGKLPSRRSRSQRRQLELESCREFECGRHATGSCTTSSCTLSRLLAPTCFKLGGHRDGSKDASDHPKNALASKVVVVVAAFLVALPRW